MGLIRGVRASAQPAALLILLHGLGSDENDLLSMAPALDPRLDVVALRAPHSYEPGFAWFELGWGADGLWVNEDQALQSLGIIAEEIQALKQEFSVGKTFLGGFSQGAIMTLGTSLTRPDLLDAALMLSPAVLPRFWLLDVPADIGKVRALVQHGSSDPVLPVSQGREATRLLRERGVDCRYEEYPMGHQVSYESLESASLWLTEQL